MQETKQKPRTSNGTNFMATLGDNWTSVPIVNAQDDKLYRLVCHAYEEAHHLRVKLHYVWCHKTRGDREE